MAPQSNLVVFLTIFLSVYVLSPSPSMVEASPKLIGKVCSGANSIVSPDFCLKLLSDPQIVAAKDLNELINAFMKSAESTAQTTLNNIAEMIKNPKSPAALQALKTCEDVYRYAVKSFGMIYGELSEDAMSANYDVSVIGPEAERCVKALAAANVDAPQIADGNQSLQSYSAMGNEITTILH